MDHTRWRASLQDWTDNIREATPWTRRTEQAYRSFSSWYDDMQDEDYMVGPSAAKQNILHSWQQLSQKEYNEQIIDFVVEESKKIREMCSDKQLLRFQKEVSLYTRDAFL